MNHTCFLAFEKELKPLIKTTADAKRCNLDLDRADVLVFANVIVPDRQVNVVSHVLHVKRD